MTRAHACSVLVGVLLAGCAAGCVGSRRAPAARTPLPAIEAEYATPTEAEEALLALEAAFVLDGDRRGVFVSTYLVMSQTIGEHMGTGFFEDDAAMARLLVTFANYYRRALRDYEAGDRAAVPEVWLRAHDFARGPQAPVHLCMLLGVTAHVRDLAFAIADDPGAAHPSRRRDYDAIVRLLPGIVDRVQWRLAQRHADAVATTDHLCLFADETFGVRWLQRLRERAWRQSQRLLQAATERERAEVADGIERAALAHMAALRRVPPWVWRLAG